MPTPSVRGVSRRRPILEQAADHRARPRGPLGPDPRRDALDEKAFFGPILEQANDFCACPRGDALDEKAFLARSPDDYPQTQHTPGRNNKMRDWKTPPPKPSANGSNQPYRDNDPVISDADIVKACNVLVDGPEIKLSLSVDDLRRLLRADLMEGLHEFFGRSPGYSSVRENHANGKMANHGPPSQFAAGGADGRPGDQNSAPFSAEGSQRPRPSRGSAQSVRDDESCFGTTALESATNMKPDDEAAINPVEELMVEEGLKHVSLKPVVRHILAFHRFLKSTKEPQRSGYLFDVIGSKSCDSFCLIVIVLNTALTIYSVDRSLASLAENGPTVEPMGLFDWLEWLFFFWYIAEISMRLAVHKLYFFINGDARWNIFDLSCVATSLMDFVLTVEGSSRTHIDMDLRYARVMRIWKITRVLRVFRAVKFFTELGLILKCFSGSLVSLLWSLVCTVFIMFIFSMIFVQGFVFLLESSTLAEDELDAIRTHFGSVSIGMGSLLQTMSGGRDWCEYYDIIWPLGFMYRMVFLFYVLFMMISTMNIISSIFIERTMRSAQPDMDVLLVEREEQNAKDTDDFLKLCRELMIDLDGDGLIEQEEMTRCMADSSVRKYFNARGVHFEDAHSLYKMLWEANRRSGSAGISLESFVKACMHLNHPCNGMDFHTLAYDVKVLHDEHKRFAKYTKEELTSLIQHSRPG